MTDIRAVIFDYGMVLSAPADPVSYRMLLDVFGAPPEVFEKHYWAHRHAYDRGVLDGREYWQRLANDAGTQASVGTPTSRPANLCGATPMTRGYLSPTYNWWSSYGTM